MESMEEKIKRYREHIKQFKGESIHYSTTIMFYAEMLNDLEEVYRKTDKRIYDRDRTAN